ncbi:MAG: hypothetical protein ACLSHC_17945 [Bilophila wadsworthia]
MQLHYFIFVGLFIEGNAGGYSPGRMARTLSLPSAMRGRHLSTPRRWNSSNACDQVRRTDLVLERTRSDALRDSVRSRTSASAAWTWTGSTR